MIFFLRFWNSIKSYKAILIKHYQIFHPKSCKFFPPPPLVLKYILPLYACLTISSCRMADICKLFFTFYCFSYACFDMIVCGENWFSNNTRHYMKRSNYKDKWNENEKLKNCKYNIILIGNLGYVYIILKFSYLLGVARHPSSLRPFSLRQALPKERKFNGYSDDFHSFSDGPFLKRLLFSIFQMWNMIYSPVGKENNCYSIPI